MSVVLKKEKEICTYCFNEIRFKDETWLKLNFVCPKDKTIKESYYCDLTCLFKEMKKVKERVDDYIMKSIFKLRGKKIKLKICSKCGKSKPLTEFYKNPYNKDGLAYSCKACRRKRYLEKK